MGKENGQKFPLKSLKYKKDQLRINKISKAKRKLKQLKKLLNYFQSIISQQETFKVEKTVSLNKVTEILLFYWYEGTAKCCASSCFICTSSAKITVSTL